MTHIKKFTLGLLACLMIAAATIGCSKNDNTGKTGTIYGIVTVTGEPLKGIGVSLFVDDALLLKTVTYDDGHYEFSDLQPGKYTLKVETEGYETFSTSVIVEAGRQARADMQLTVVETHMDVVTFEAVVSGNAALLKGHYHRYDSYYEPNEVGFYYSTSTPVSNGTKVKTNDVENVGSNSYDFRVVVPDLMPGTYYVQAYAKNSYGTAFGDIKTFAISGDPNVENIISIPALGLMIQKYDISSGSPWSTANTLCENSTIGGYTDWRLPTSGELQSLQTYAESVNWNENFVGVFSHIVSTCGYWSSKYYDADHHYAVWMKNGTMDYRLNSVEFHVRAVRNL